MNKKKWIWGIIASVAVAAILAVIFFQQRKQETVKIGAVLSITGAGKQIGEQVLKDFGNDAEIVIGIVTEPSEIPTVQRTQGFVDIVSTNPNVVFAQSVDGNVKPDDSMKVTTEMLQANPDIDMIWADTGPHSQGALQAVKSMGLDVKVYGFAISEYPIEDLYPACAAQEPYEYAKIVLQLIKDYLDGKDVPDEVLRPLKIFTEGAPAPGEVG